MAVVGRIVFMLGVTALLFAGYLLLMETGCTNGAGFELCLPNVVYPASAIIAALGVFGIVIGRHMIREAREAREFDEAMKQIDQSKNNTVHRS